MSSHDWWDTSRGCASLSRRFNILINILGSEYITGMPAYKLRREMDMYFNRHKIFSGHY
jgi:hypothetical protein